MGNRSPCSRERARGGDAGGRRGLLARGGSSGLVGRPTSAPPMQLPALPAMRPEAFVAVVDTNQWLHDFEQVASLARTAPPGRVVIGVPQASPSPNWLVLTLALT